MLPDFKVTQAGPDFCVYDEDAAALVARRLSGFVE
jgi:hypothetical protein